MRRTWIQCIGLTAVAAIMLGAAAVAPAAAAPATRVTLNGTVDTAITVGKPDAIGVDMRDGANARDTSYTGTVTFSATCGDCFTIAPDNGGGSSKSYTFGLGDGGLKSIALIWTQAGNHSLTLTGTLLGGGTNAITVSGINVTTTDATRVVMLGVDTSVTAGVSDPVSLEMRNAQGERATTYVGTVTFSATCGDCFTIAPNNGGASSKSYTFGVGDGGVKNLGLTWAQVGTHAVTVTATLPAGGTSAATVPGITVTTTDATRVSIPVFTTNVPVGVARPIDVELRDAQGQRSTTYAGTVSFSATCGDCFTVTPNNGGAADKAYTFVPADAGLKRFSLTWSQAGTHALTVTAGLPAGGTATATVTGFNVTAPTTTTVAPTTTTVAPTTTSTTVAPTTTTTACSNPRGIISGTMERLAVGLGARFRFGQLLHAMAVLLCRLGF